MTGGLVTRPVVTGWTLPISFLTCVTWLVKTGMFTLVASCCGTKVDVGVTMGTEVEGVLTMCATVTGLTMVPPIEDETEAVRPMIAEGRTAGWK